MLESAATELAGKLPGSPERVLDVGAGSGVWSLAMAKRHDETRVVALDLPAVLEAFRHRAAALGLDDRVETLPGDYYEVELPPACFDGVILANVLHLEPPSRARVLISRLAPTLRSGGDLIVVDSFGGGTPERELARAIYALNLALRTTGGKAHERSVIESWTEEATLAPAGFIELESGPARSGRSGPTVPARTLPKRASLCPAHALRLGHTAVIKMFEPMHGSRSVRRSPGHLGR